MVWDDFQVEQENAFTIWVLKYFVLLSLSVNIIFYVLLPDEYSMIICELLAYELLMLMFKANYIDYYHKIRVLFSSNLGKGVDCSFKFNNCSKKIGNWIDNLPAYFLMRYLYKQAALYQNLIIGKLKGKTTIKACKRFPNY